MIQLSAHNPLVGPFQCSSGDVIPIAALCNGTDDCANGEDEDNNVCPGKSEECFCNEA